jgi:hypothetical protein
MIYLPQIQFLAQFSGSKNTNLMPIFETLFGISQENQKYPRIPENSISIFSANNTFKQTKLST